VITNYKKEKVMPVVQIQVWKGRSVEQKRAVSKAITEAMVEHMGVSPDGLDIIIQDYELENWARAGVLGIDRADIPKSELDKHR